MAGNWNENGIDSVKCIHTYILYSLNTYTWPLNSNLSVNETWELKIKEWRNRDWIREQQITLMYIIKNWLSVFSSVFPLPLSLPLSLFSLKPQKIPLSYFVVCPSVLSGTRCVIFSLRLFLIEHMYCLNLEQ